MDDTTPALPMRSANLTEAEVFAALDALFNDSGRRKVPTIRAIHGHLQRGSFGTIWRLRKQWHAARRVQENALAARSDKNPGTPPLEVIPMLAEERRLTDETISGLEDDAECLAAENELLLARNKELAQLLEASKSKCNQLETELRQSSATGTSEIVTALAALLSPVVSPSDSATSLSRPGVESALALAAEVKGLGARIDHIASVVEHAFPDAARQAQNAAVLEMIRKRVAAANAAVNRPGNA